MKQRSTLALGALVGAAAGLAVAFVLFTERGRRLRAQVQPEIEGLVREAGKIRAAVDALRTGRPAGSRTAAPAPLAWPRRAE